MNNSASLTLKISVFGTFKSITIYEFNVCSMPKAMGQRLLLNQEMWNISNEEQINKIPNINSKLSNFTISVSNQGNRIVDGENLELINNDVLDEMLAYNLFPVFNACFQENVENHHRDLTSLCISKDELVILGWEVVNCFGSGSASYDGIYPLNSYSDYFYLKEPKEYFPINKWGLFESVESTSQYIELNNKRNANIGPWFSNPVLTTKNTLTKLEEIYQTYCGHIKGY